MRGKAAQQRGPRITPGITPACAGKSRSRHVCISRRRDHPRMCGEKYQLGVVKLLSEGSPPHVRGKEKRPLPNPDHCRITPACAGKRVRGIPRTYNTRDHPRMCGEKKDNPDEWSEVQGSPPHVRGKARAYPAFIYSCGITPACAGKRFSTPSIPQARGDHPRMCGEKSPSTRQSLRTTGSPPHVRGKD